jgi:hypothetical protein
MHSGTSLRTLKSPGEGQQPAVIGHIVKWIKAPLDESPRQQVQDEVLPQATLPGRRRNCRPYSAGLEGSSSTEASLFRLPARARFGGSLQPSSGNLQCRWLGAAKMASREQGGCQDE